MSPGNLYLLLGAVSILVPLVEKKISKRVLSRLAFHSGYNRLRNLQSRKRAFQVGEQHYDIGNDLFLAMLDPTMSYSCAYWENATTLEQAQRN